MGNHHLCVSRHGLSSFPMVLLLATHDVFFVQKFLPPEPHCSSPGGSAASRASCQVLHIRAGELITHSTSLLSSLPSCWPPARMSCCSLAVPENVAGLALLESSALPDVHPDSRAQHRRQGAFCESSGSLSSTRTQALKSQQVQKEGKGRCRLLVQKGAQQKEVGLDQCRRGPSQLQGADRKVVQHWAS